MTSTEKARDLIFNFERPETPTEIRSTFGVGANAGLNLRSPVGEDGRDSPMLTCDTTLNIETGYKEPSSRQNSVSGSISDEEDLTTEEQLSLAQERIKELERKLELVERELRQSQERAKKLASHGQRLRRLARSGDLFRRHQTSVDNAIDVADKEGPIAEYVTLSIAEIVSREVSRGNGEPTSSAIPLYLRRFEGQTYVVGPKGVTIGSGNYCGIWIPEEADIKDNHASIQWDEVSKSFRLANGKSACADVTITSVPSSDESHLKSLQENGGFPLLNQLKFKTGLIEWTVSPVPRRKLVVSRLFDSLRKNDITELQEQWLYAESWNNYLKKLHIDRSTRMLYMIDSNAEEDPDYRIIDEQAKKSPKFSEEVTDAPSMYDGNSGSAGKFCLLHIAVDNLFLEGALFLLEKGAEVNKRCGNAKLSPLHIAVKRGNLEMTQLLLHYGADLELTDSGHHTAVALAGSYQLRKVLLSSLMLCAAAEGGDFEEVRRLIEAGTSPNGKALCHKAPLHLASLNGNVKVVEFLLEKGVSFVVY